MLRAESETRSDLLRLCNLARLWLCTTNMRRHDVVTTITDEPYLYPRVLGRTKYASAVHPVPVITARRLSHLAETVRLSELLSHLLQAVRSHTGRELPAAILGP